MHQLIHSYKSKLLVNKDIKDPYFPDASFYVLSLQSSNIPPADVAEILGCKTNIYLDIYNSRTIDGCLILTIIFVNILGIALLFDGSFNYVIIIMWLILFFSLLLLVIYYYLKPPPPPIIRFNRERRQLCIRVAKSAYSYIDWDKVIPIYRHSVFWTKSGYRGAYALVLYIKDESNKDNLTNIYELGCLDELALFQQWECIRGFMEEGADFCPDSQANATYIEQGDDIHAPFKNWILYKKIPTFVDPEVIAWSQPMRNNSL